MAAAAHGEPNMMGARLALAGGAPGSAGRDGAGPGAGEGAVSDWDREGQGCRQRYAPVSPGGGGWRTQSGHTDAHASAERTKASQTRHQARKQRHGETPT